MDTVKVAMYDNGGENADGTKYNHYLLGLVMYAIIGAGDFLGSYIVRKLMEKTDEEILATTRDERDIVDGRIEWMFCDVSDDDSLRRLTRRINAGRHVKIIYLPAFFNTGKEYDRRAAWNTNIVTYARFIALLDGFDVFYSISTDLVFSQDSLIPYMDN